MGPTPPHNRESSIEGGRSGGERSPRRARTNEERSDTISPTLAHGPLDRVRELERQLTDRASVAEEAENRAERSETRAAELEERRREEAAEERSEAESREAELLAMTWRSEEDLLETRREHAELTVRFEESEQQSPAARDASLQQAELQ